MSARSKKLQKAESVPLAWRMQLWGISMISRALIGGLQSTVKVNVAGEENMDAALRTQRPVIIATWHENIFAFLFYRLSTQLPYGLSMISRSRDGDIGVAITQPWGIEAVRASSSRGGMVGLLQLCRRLERNDHPGQSVVAGLTVDGPRGPRRKSKPGILALAKRSKALLLPSATDCAPKTTLGSWDRQRVPLPFSRCSIRLGKPISLDAPPEARASTGQSESDSIDHRPDLTVDELDRILADLTAACEID